MKKVFLKKAIVTLILVALLFSWCGSVSINVTFAESYSSDSTEEEKVYSSYTLEDNFKDDSVIVVIFHKDSALDREFFKEDFPGVDIDEIVYLSSLKDPNKEYPMINLNKYHQILELKLTTPGKSNVLEAIKVLEENPLVMSAEPNLVFYMDDIIYTDELPPSFNQLTFNDNTAELTATTITPNDPYYSDQYSLKLIDAENAWGLTTGSSSVKVGVIDSGVYNHTDLSANLLSGWDFVNNNAITTDDTLGHGTAVAGLIAAVGNNNIGIVGVAWNVKIVPLQVVNSSGSFSISAIIDAITYAKNENIPIINMSLGHLTNNNAYASAIEEYDGLICCSAGNDGVNTDNSPHYPSCDDADNIISVANSTSTDVLSSDSNYGATTVDLAAPGTKLKILTADGNYRVSSGTSYSSPLVAGTAALLLSYNPNLSTKE